MEARFSRKKQEQPRKAPGESRTARGHRPARVANRVRDIREECLLTREELAQRAHLSLRTVWSVENGHPCRLPTKRKILEALGIARKDHKILFPNG